jgi:long-chain acyl-CoA synthetase
MSTVLHRLSRWAESDPLSAAQRFKKNNVWETITAGEFRDRVYHLALFLESKGMTRDDIGCILSTNCPQWVHMDLAALLVGAKSAGLYPNSTGKDIQYILNHTSAKVLAVQNKEFFDKMGAAGLPKSVSLVIVFDGDTTVSPSAVSYEAALTEGRRLANAAGARTFDDYLSKLDPNVGAFMIYTSGTTGNPKGALLSHDNLTFTSDLASRYWKLPVGRGTLFSFLPLCHIAEKLQNVGVGISQRYTVNFCTKFDNVAIELPEVQPTLLLCVPRLWEKMMEGVQNKVARGKGVKKQLAIWALGVGERVAAARFSGQEPSTLDLLQYRLADKLVLSKVRHALGLGLAETLASGAAALPAHVAKWFRSIGLEILEDFGQTESTGVICMTERGVEAAGTVGKAVPGIDFKLAEDGEILTRGRHVFVGYYKEEASTAQTLEGGWLHTGDLGEVTPAGLIRIRGRKKEIMKTSGGKMIAPLPIEEALKVAPMISQVCMVGDGRKYLSALITLSEGAMATIMNGNGSVKDTVITLPEVVAQVRRHVDELNGTLANYEQIKKFAVLSKEFSIVDDEMTPTLKMKRGVIENRYRKIIDGMYSVAE